MEDYEQDGKELSVISSDEELNESKERVEYLRQKVHEDPQEEEKLELALLMRAIEEYEKKMKGGMSEEKEK